MPLSAGDKLGPYEILSPIGEGGMGEVWKARDTRLDRIVALKVSKQEFSERFEREARAVAALNHPHICTLHDVGPNYLVFEYVDGEPLNGPLPLDKTLEYASQVCDALDAAHSEKITHRDLKPANILVTKQGVKLLDFGLAKIDRPVDLGEETLTMGLTMKGQILGTLLYMSPEQLQAKEADARSDIFSFGCVLYEMLTGKHAFEGASPASVIAAILERPAPSVTDIASPVLDRLLKRCLEKNPEDRWQSARDVKSALELTAVPGKTSAPAAGKTRLPWAVAVAACLAAVVLGMAVFLKRPEHSASVVRFQFPAPEEAGVGVPIISPDGTKVIVWSATQLWVRSFDSLEARLLANTDGTFVETPFWTADSRFVVYAADGMLKKVDASGGPPVSLCELPGGLWGGFTLDDGRILFAAVPGGFLVVPPTGGAASRLAIPGMDTELGQYPMPLPDGKHFIFNASGVTGAGTPGIYVASLDGRAKVRRLLPDVSKAAYVPSQASDSGYLLFQRDQTLMAQPFNAEKLELTGDPVSIATDTGRSVAANGFSASESGALLYRTGRSQSKLTWFDRQGKQLGTAWAPGAYTELSISPDGSRVAVVRTDNPPATWIHEFATETSTRLIPQGAAVKPIWSPDSKNLVFAGAVNAGAADLYESSANGPRDARLLVSMKPELTKWAWDWSSDGRWLLFSIADRKTKEDLWVLPIQGGGQPEPFLATDFAETDGAFSPDGRFVAYVSDESGKFEVYVRSFPSAGGGKWLISSGGGYQPRWRRDGKELFFFTAEGKLMSVDVTPGAAFKAGVPKFLFQTSIFGGGATTDNHYWDVAPDGKRFLVNVVEGGPAPVTVVLNWQAGLGK